MDRPRPKNHSQGPIYQQSRLGWYLLFKAFHSLDCTMETLRAKRWPRRTKALISALTTFTINNTSTDFQLNAIEYKWDIVAQSLTLGTYCFASRANRASLKGLQMPGEPNARSRNSHRGGRATCQFYLNDGNRLEFCWFMFNLFRWVEIKMIPISAQFCRFISCSSMSNSERMIQVPNSKTPEDYGKFIVCVFMQTLTRLHSRSTM